MWSKIRAVLTVLTDILIFGRAKEWWRLKHGPGAGTGEFTRKEK